MRKKQLFNSLKPKIKGRKLQKGLWVFARKKRNRGNLSNALVKMEIKFLFANYNYYTATNIISFRNSLPRAF